MGGECGVSSNRRVWWDHGPMHGAWGALFSHTLCRAVL